MKVASGARILMMANEDTCLDTNNHLFNVKLNVSYWIAYIHHYLMQPSMGTLNSLSLRVVKDSTPSRRRILVCINFGIGESSRNLFFKMVNLYLVKFEARWILNEWKCYCFVIFFIWKWILTWKKKQISLVNLHPTLFSWQWTLTHLL